MRDDTPSRTAAWVAAARHLGRLLPPDAQLADDPYGAAFTSRALARLVDRAPQHLARVPGLRAWVLYMQVRTRVIDDVVREIVATEGCRQIVLLGAGYDTRSLRLPELADARVYEIDHPATQRHKRHALERMGVDSPSQFVAWDFEARPVDDLPEELARAGHDASAPTLTIWEGVTMYLTEPAIDASLRAIAAWSAPRSRLAMTYFARGRLERPSLALRAMQTVVSQLGEPWRWGWQPEQLPAYLAERGLELDADIAIPDAARELLPPALAVHLATDTYKRIAIADAPESIAVAHR